MTCRRVEKNLIDDVCFNGQAIQSLSSKDQVDKADEPDPHFDPKDTLDRRNFDDYKAKGLLDIVDRKQNFKGCGTCSSKLMNPDLDMDVESKNLRKMGSRKRTAVKSFRIRSPPARMSKTARLTK